VNGTARYDIGVDIGGTFTDFVMRRRQDGALRLHKALTSPDDPSRSVMEGIAALLAQAETDAEAIATVVHGTTLITNALIERRGAKTALVTTAGHRDVLEIGTELRYDAYDLAIDTPQPLVPRPLRFEVEERLDYRGRVVRPLDTESAAQVIAGLREAGVESIAICFLHAFRDPRHEQAFAELARQAGVEWSISTSSEVAPEIREYQRMSTTVANAYVKPLTRRYVHKIQSELRAAGYRHDLYLMLSSGGIGGADLAQAFPIQLLESGPAGGVLFAAFVGRMTGRREIVSFDMGGTTAKMAFVADGAPLLARAFEVARVSRFRMGSGLPVQVPVIEMIEIGAGGGSIATRDDLGLLKVGPRSAGASPGPACYGFGGSQPTVTDANLILGYIAADSFLGGTMKLDRERAREAIEREVAIPLGIDLISAARGMFDVVNENMVSATKVHVAEKGRDPRRASLFAFGGAGPIHAHAIARALRMREVICPLRAGVASALGFLTAPMAFDFARSLTMPFERLEASTLAETFAAMEARGTATLTAAGTPAELVSHRRSCDMRYVGQGHEIEVPLPGGPIDASFLEAVAERFAARYAELYGRAHPEVAMEFVTCRVTSSGPDPDVTLPAVAAADDGAAAAACTGSRDVYFGNPGTPGAFLATAVYDRYRLAAGATIVGPAVVEERESTVVIPPGMLGSVDRYGNLVLTFTPGGAA
jgi:N-methylhydantoinase A/oxoprolinase/acetone carboxylase beta subunit